MLFVWDPVVHIPHFYGTQSVKQQQLRDNYSFTKFYIVCGQVLIYLAEPICPGIE